jgi:hypothetical protein
VAEIIAKFCSHFSESRLWTILDIGRDPEAPMELFSGYLESGECAGPFTLYSKDGHFGHAGWRRSDASIMEEGDVEDGGTVEMG